jgi:hypothetical protein
MTAVGWRVVASVAELLEWNEREVVLGDLAEAGDSAWRGVLDLAGLVARRQVLLWKSWQPWLAAFGWTLPCSFLLMGFSLSVSGAFRQVVDKGIVGGGLMPLICRIVLLLVWAWSGGFMVGTVSRKTLWVSAATCFAPCLFCLSRFGVPHESPISLLLFLAPGIWGAWRGLRGVRIGFKTALALAVTATVLTIPVWMGQWVFVLALIWPGWFLVARICQQPAKA